MTAQPEVCRTRPVTVDMMDAQAQAVVRELLDAHDALVQDMYDSDLEASWAGSGQRYREAAAAAEDLLAQPPAEELRLKLEHLMTLRAQEKYAEALEALREL